MDGENVTLGSGRMDTMGDAEQFDDDDEVPRRPRHPVLSPEALAVTSLVSAVSSLLVSGISQSVVFLLANSLGVTNGDDEEKQFAMFMTPVGILSFVAVACGLTALKRQSDDRWVSALAFAGAALGAVIFLLVATGFLIVFTGNPNASLDN
jgi:hypothetical protein